MEVTQKKLQVFCLPDGKQPFIEWLRSLRDERAAARIKTRLARVRLGNLGDVESVGEGVQELKVNYGPGYRVYFVQVGNEFVILLCAGDKRTQDEDIRKAKQYWSDYKKERSHADY